MHALDVRQLFKPISPWFGVTATVKWISYPLLGIYIHVFFLFFSTLYMEKYEKKIIVQIL